MNSRDSDSSEPDAPQPRERFKLDNPEEGAAASLPLPKKKIVRDRAPTGDYVPERVVLTIPEAAKAMGVSTYFLVRRIREGDLRVSRLGPKIIRILPSALQAWAERTQTEVGSSNEVAQAVESEDDPEETA